MVSNLRLEHWQVLHQQLRGIAKRRAALDAEEARCLREADTLKLSAANLIPNATSLTLTTATFDRKSLRLHRTKNLASSCSTNI